MTSQIIYLATPYSHPDPDVRLARYHTVNRVAAKMMRLGDIVYSPISHSHQMAIDYGLPTDWGYWARSCTTIVSACAAMVVLRQDGWRESIGVTAEIEVARKHCLQIGYLDP